MHNVHCHALFTWDLPICLLCFSQWSKWSELQCSWFTKSKKGEVFINTFLSANPIAPRASMSVANRRILHSSAIIRVFLLPRRVRPPSWTSKGPNASSFARRQSSSTPWLWESLLCCAISNEKKTNFKKNKLWRKKRPLFKKCLLIQIVLYRVCKFLKVQEWWLQCFVFLPGQTTLSLNTMYCSLCFISVFPHIYIFLLSSSTFSPNHVFAVK